ncbi:MAG: three-Cys-motif partner protein TcmP [Chryseotalea sp.]|jgi:three-Cys-motif partner protein
MSRDLHRAPFDEGTRAKLSIFKDYLKEWLPVFLAKRDVFWNTINVFDFFAGPGSDINGNKGTPLIIMEQLQPYYDNIINKNLFVNLYFNEFDESKQKELKLKIRNAKSDALPVNIEIESLDFKDAFEKQYAKMKSKNCVNILFLDQYGVRQINEDIFKRIIELKRTDFLFFVSSSTIKRFSDHPNISQHIKLNAEEIERTPFHKIHRLVLEYYKSLIPKDKEYYLGSFSLKKGSGVYGLIFGSGHVLGIEKFLLTSWGIDPERGEANFDIDDDRIIPGQVELFSGEVRKPKKVDNFETELTKKILNNELLNDKDIYLFTISNGFTPKHARKVISKLISDKKIDRCSLVLSSSICKTGVELTKIKLL